RNPPNPDVLRPKIRPRMLLVDSDTDVEGEEADPDVRPSKRRKTPRNVPETPDVGQKPPNPDVPGPKSGHRALLVESDTDVEEDPDMEPLKRLKMTQNVPETPDVRLRTPNPDVPGPKSGHRALLVESDTDVRRSLRLAERRGGGASAGPSPTEKGRGQAQRPRPSPKPRPQTRRSQSGEGHEVTPPSVPIKGSGRGSAVTPPPQEEEPAGGAKRRLRPRTAPGPAPIRVLFTGLVASPALLVALGTLGGTEATSVHDCSHLVTDGARRTLKLLCALARGVPIVTPEWLLQ
ncbi:MDC1 protein, partial [Corvus moneduloides]|nr:MDC1 protein [Corvus moneduloides]